MIFTYVKNKYYTTFLLIIFCVSLKQMKDTLDLNMKVESHLYLVPRVESRGLSSLYIKSTLPLKKVVELVDIFHDRGFKIIELSQDDFKIAYGKYSTTCHVIEEKSFDRFKEKYYI